MNSGAEYREPIAGVLDLLQCHFGEGSGWFIWHFPAFGFSRLAVSVRNRLFFCHGRTVCCEPQEELGRRMCNSRLSSRDVALFFIVGAFCLSPFLTFPPLMQLLLGIGCSISINVTTLTSIGWIGRGLVPSHAYCMYNSWQVDLPSIATL